MAKPDDQPWLNEAGPRESYGFSIKWKEI